MKNSRFPRRWVSNGYSVATCFGVMQRRWKKRPSYVSRNWPVLKVIRISSVLRGSRDWSIDQMRIGDDSASRIVVRSEWAGIGGTTGSRRRCTDAIKRKPINRFSTLDEGDSRRYLAGLMFPISGNRSTAAPMVKLQSQPVQQPSFRISSTLVSNATIVPREYSNLVVCSYE